MIVTVTVFGLLGAARMMIAAPLHNLGTLLVLGNVGRLLRFEEPLGQPRPAMEGREEEGTP